MKPSGSTGLRTCRRGNDRRYRILCRFTIRDARARDHRRATQWAVVLLVAFSRIELQVRLPASIIRKRSREHARTHEEILCRVGSAIFSFSFSLVVYLRVRYKIYQAGSRSFLLRQCRRSTSVGPPGRELGVCVFSILTDKMCFY